MLGLASACLTAFLSMPAVPEASAAACQEGASARMDSHGPQWNGWSPTATNARFQEEAAAGLSAEGVKKLKLKWALNFGGVRVARAQPVIIGDRLFTASQSGDAYALDVATGCVRWRFQADHGLRSGVTFGNAKEPRPCSSVTQREPCTRSMPTPAA